MSDTSVVDPSVAAIRGIVDELNDRIADKIEKPISIFALFETDIDHAENGKWFENFGGSGIAFKIARFSSKRSQGARLIAEEVYRKLLPQRNSPLTSDILEKISTEQMATGVVLDWKGLYDDDGVEIPYSTAKARELLNRLPELRLAIAATSLDMDNFRVETRKAVVGNSSST